MLQLHRCRTIITGTVTLVLTTLVNKDALRTIVSNSAPSLWATKLPFKWLTIAWPWISSKTCMKGRASPLPKLSTGLAVAQRTALKRLVSTDQLRCRVQRHRTIKQFGTQNFVSGWETQSISSSKISLASKLETECSKTTDLSKNAPTYRDRSTTWNRERLNLRAQSRTQNLTSTAKK